MPPYSCFVEWQPAPDTQDTDKRCAQAADDSNRWLGCEATNVASLWLSQEFISELQVNSRISPMPGREPNTRMQSSPVVENYPQRPPCRTANVERTVICQRQIDKANRPEQAGASRQPPTVARAFLRVLEERAGPGAARSDANGHRRVHRHSCYRLSCATWLSAHVCRSTCASQPSCPSSEGDIPRIGLSYSQSGLWTKPLHDPHGSVLSWMRSSGGWQATLERWRAWRLTCSVAFAH